jgi:hypothetical protein
MEELFGRDEEEGVEVRRDEEELEWEWRLGGGGVRSKKELGKDGRGA